MNSDKTIYLIDGSAYIYRAYHAVRGLSNSRGLPTNATFGFTRMLIKLVKERTPEYMVIFFDVKGPTFRHKIYEDYKANRPPMPEDLVLQIPYIKDITRGFNIPVMELEGFEADDLIGTAAQKAENKGFKVVMVTGDKDFVQLVTDRSIIWDPMKEKTTDADTVRKESGLEPLQMIDVMGLSGDKADNIPGVPGIGPKTAISLIKNFDSMEGLYEQVDTITKKKQHEKLVKFKDQAFLSKDLVTIDRNVPLKFVPEDYKYRSPDNEILAELFKELEFRRLQQDFPKKTDLSNKHYHAVYTEDELFRLRERLEASDIFALDTETTSKDAMHADLVGVSFSIKPDEAYYIPCGHKYPGAPEQLDKTYVLGQLKQLLENPEIKKIGQNIKYDWIVLARHGVNLAGVVFDTMLASYLLNPSKRAHSLDQIALDFLDHKTISYTDVIKNVKDAKDGGKNGFASVPLEQGVPYACEDADITLMACEVLEKEIEQAGLNKLMDEVEMPLVPVLKDMEMQGICVDTKRLKSLSTSFAERLTFLEQDIFSAAGEEFNINSSQQLGSILFEKLNLPVQKKTKKKTAYSTDVDVLTKLAPMHELPELVLKYRTLAKLKSTYTDSLLALIHPETGRVHTSFNQTVTATGRLSSSRPNLQNIPIRGDEGVEIRKAFIPRPGWMLVAADYSQIELRILAHYSDDNILIKAFLDEEDIHTRTAAEVFQVFPSFITPDLRRQAKTINFGIVYGMSPYGLSKELDISRKMAKQYIDSYFARYKGVKRFINETIEAAGRTKTTSTLLGRVRLLPDIDSPKKTLREYAERTAINTPIQGTAADLIKIAMINVNQAFKDKGLKAAMLLSVHDEILFETPPEELDASEELVKEIMEHVMDLKVPLKVNLDAGKNWAEAH